MASNGPSVREVEGGGLGSPTRAAMRSSRPRSHLTFFSCIDPSSNGRIPGSISVSPGSAPLWGPTGEAVFTVGMQWWWYFNGDINVLSNKAQTTVALSAPTAKLLHCLCTELKVPPQRCGNCIAMPEVSEN